MGKKTKIAPAAGPGPAAEPAMAPAAEPSRATRQALPSGPVAMDAGIDAAASAGAPFLYFETANVSGCLHGVIRVTLEAGRIMPSDQGRVFADRVMVGHLRMSIPAAQSLRSALDRALLIAKPAATETRK